MPLPSIAFTIHGGCNCRAMRYTVNIPDLTKRPQNPYRTPGAKLDEDLRVPMVAVDHCNDCRRATGAILPMFLVTAIETVDVSCVSRGGASSDRIITAEELFRFESVAEKDVYLTFYKSSEGRTRWFCSRCGTSLAYTVDEGVIPAKWGW